MTLKEFRNKYRIRLWELKRDTGLAISTLCEASKGTPISRNAALAIEKATKGRVSAVGLVFPEKMVKS